MPRIKVKDPKSGSVVVLDQIRQPLFDTITLDDSSTLLGIKSFFTQVQNKSEFETNLRANGQLEQSVSFRVQGLAMDAQTVENTPATINDLFLAKMMEHSSLKFRVGEKYYWEGPMRFATGRISTVHELGGTDAVAYHASQFGKPAVAGIILAKKDSIDIPPLQSFRVDWNTQELAGVTIKANTDIKFVCSLKGLLRRPVQ